MGLPAELPPEQRVHRNTGLGGGDVFGGHGLARA